MKSMLGRERMYSKAFANLGRKDVVLWEVLHIKKEQEFYLEFISTNSKYKQGIRLAIDAGEGYLEINNICSQQFNLWEDTAPQKTYIRCVSEEGRLSVYNIFDKGKSNGGRCSQLGYCGMLIERKDDTILFQCNDSGVDTEFDKLVFKIDLL